MRKLYDFFRKHRYVIFLALRELLWKVGKWNNERLEGFVRDNRIESVMFLGFRDGIPELLAASDILVSV